MPLKVKINGVWTDVKGVFVKGAGIWHREHMRIKASGVWVDANVRTEQFAATKTRSFDAGYEFLDGEQTSLNVWAADTGLRQGSYSYQAIDPLQDDLFTAYHGPFYGTMFFGTGAGTPTALSGKALLSARIYLRRESSGGSGSDPITVYATTLTDVPNAGAHIPHGEVTGSGSLIAMLGLGEGGWYNLPLTLAAQAIAGKCLCIYSGGSNYAVLYGIENATYKPKIELTYY